MALFHGLSDHTRLAIVSRVAQGEARVAGRAQGRQMLCALARPELLDLLAAAETLLEVTGNVVALCSTYSPDAHVQTATADASSAPGSDDEAGAGRGAETGTREVCA